MTNYPVKGSRAVGGRIDPERLCANDSPVSEEPDQMTVPRNFPLVAGGPINQHQLAEHWTKGLAAAPVESKVMGLAQAIRRK